MHTDSITLPTTEYHALMAELADLRQRLQQRSPVPVNRQANNSHSVNDPSGMADPVADPVTNSVTEAPHSPHADHASIPSDRAVLQAVLDTSPYLIFWKDRQSVYLGCNQAFAEAAGVASTAEIIGKTDLELPWTAEEAQCYRADDRQVMESNTPKFHIVETQQQANGQQVWVDTCKIPLQNSQGRVVGILGAYQDISDRRQTELALAESETRLQRLTDNVPGVLYQFSLAPDGTRSFDFVSSGSQELWNLQVEEVIANSALPFASIHPEDLPGLEASILKSAETLKTWQYQWRTIMPSGDTKWMKGISRPRCNDGGGITWDGCVIDISEQQEALQDREAAKLALARLNEELEVRIEQRTQQLRQSEERLRALLSSAPLILFAVDRDGQITFADGKGLEILDINPSDVLGESIYELYPSATDIHDFVNQALAGDETTGTVCHRGLWFENRYSPIRDESGAIAGVIGVALDITHRVHVEESLRRSRLRFQKLADNVPGMIYQFRRTPDGEMSFTYVSERCRDIHEVEPDKTDCIFEQVYAPDWDALRDHIAQSSAQLTDFQHEWRIITPSGHLKWVEAIAKPERQEDGSVLWDGLLLDISDRKQTEASLRQNEMRFKAIFENAGVPMTLARPDGEVVETNPASLQFFGYTEEEYRQLTFEDYTHPDELERDLELYQELIDGKRDYYQLEKRYLRKSGEVVWGRLTLTSVRDDWGNLLYTVGMTEDITKQRQALIDRQHTERELREREQFLRSIYDGADQAIFVLDVHTLDNIRYASFNRVAECIAGVNSLDAQGRTPEELFGSEIGHNLRRNYEQCARRGIPVSFEECVSLPGISETWWLSTLSPLRNDQGQVYRIIGTGIDITERKRAEQALMLYKQAVENSSDAIAIADAEGNHFYQNSAFSQLYECKSTEEFDIFGGLAETFTANEPIQELQQAIALGLSWIGEVEQQSCQGRIFQSLLRADAIRDASGQRIGLITTTTDISDRKQAEFALRQTTHALQDAQRLAHIGNWEYDAQTQDVSWSDEILRIYGLHIGRATPSDLLQQCHAEDRPRIQEAIATALQGGSGFDIEYRILRPDHSIRYVNSKGEIIWNAEQQVVGLFGTLLDITERKETEKALQQSQAMLRLVIDSIPHRIFWKDINLVYMGCNQQQAEVAGLSSPDEIIGKTDYDLPWSEEEANFYRSCDRRVIDENLADYRILETQQQLNGEHRWLDAHKIPLHDPDGRTIGVLGVVEDITDRQRADEALRQSEAQLRQQATDLEQTLDELQRTQMQLVQSEKMSGLGQLVAGVAHEINNPVNFIFGNLIHADSYTQDLLGLLHRYQDHYPSPHPDIQDEIENIDLPFLIEDLPNLLQSMKVGADRIQKIVASLRTFSRMDEADMKAVNIHDGIDSTLMILQNRLKAKPDRPAIDVIKSYGELPMVECYPGQLNQVFMNVLSNAIDALDDRDQQRTADEKVENPSCIHITTEQDGTNQVVIRIRDNGPGIPDQIQQRLFNPFFTTKPVGKGTGLGMSISYQIVTEKHGGQLHCVSTLGQGAEFVITIPIFQSCQRNGAGS